MPIHISTSPTWTVAKASLALQRQDGNHLLDLNSPGERIATKELPQMPSYGYPTFSMLTTYCYLVNFVDSASCMRGGLYFYVCIRSYACPSVGWLVGLSVYHANVQNPLKLVILVPIFILVTFPLSFTFIHSHSLSFTFSIFIHP